MHSPHFSHVLVIVTWTHVESNTTGLLFSHTNPETSFSPVYKSLISHLDSLIRLSVHMARRHPRSSRAHVERTNLVTDTVSDH